MTALTIAVWILVIEVSIGLIAIIIFLMNIRKEIKRTLDDTHKLINNLDEKVDLLGNELHSTLKNSSEITANLKNTVKKANNTLSIINGIAPFAAIFIASRRTNGSNKTVLGKVIKIGRYVMAAYQGFLIFRKYFSRGGKENG
jgi:uncharacterized protein YoxC